MPVRIEGTSLWFQLDTGSDVSLVYGRALAREYKWPEEKLENRYDVIRVEGSVGATPFSRRLIRVHDGMAAEASGPDATQGTVGMDLIVGRVLVVDFEGARFCIVDRVPEALERRAHFVPATLAKNRLFPHVLLGGKPRQDLFYDTGSSLVPLALDQADWRALTGRDGNEPDNKRMEATSWGQKTSLVGATVPGGLQVGNVHLGTPLAFFRTDKPDLFESWRWPSHRVGGLIGNMPFLVLW